MVVSRDKSWTYWKNNWPTDLKSRVHHAASSRRFLLGLAGITEIDSYEARVITINQGPVAMLEQIKGKVRIAIDPNNDIFIEEGLIHPADGDGETLYLAGDIRDNTLPPNYFDIVFLCGAASHENEAHALLESTLRIAARGAKISVNLTVRSPDPTAPYNFLKSLYDRLDHGLKILDVDGTATLRGYIRMAGVSSIDRKRTDSVRLHYPLTIDPRYTLERPNSFLQAILQLGDPDYSNRLARYEQFTNDFDKISSEKVGDSEPYWDNGWMPVLDCVSLYAEVATIRPEVYFEIGSGNSTKFVRRAIRDYDLNTKIISVDPYPRADVDNICDKFYRCSLEELSLESLSDLQTQNGIMFIDGSHYCFANSDVTVFFLEILPRLQSTWLIGAHDIMLPFDYLNKGMRFYNEQYLLAPLILEHAIETVFPSLYVTKHPVLGPRALSIVKRSVVSWQGGAIYWFRRKANIQSQAKRDQGRKIPPAKRRSRVARSAVTREKL